MGVVTSLSCCCCSNSASIMTLSTCGASRMNDSPRLVAEDRDVRGRIICCSGAFQINDLLSLCPVFLFHAPISLSDSTAILEDASP